MLNQIQVEKISDFQLLKDRVYENIKKSIIDLSLLPNDQLVENRLAEKMGVSKSPVREALLRLEIEGLVYTHPFKGCFVAEITEKDICEIFQLREALETFCIGHASESISEEEIQAVRKILFKAEEALRLDDVDLFNMSSTKFHEFFIFNIKNKKIINTYSTLKDQLDRYRYIAGRIQGRMVKSHQEHISIVEAIEQKDVVHSMKRMSIHLCSLLEEFLQSKEFKSFCQNRRGPIA